jgi:hypothetical protein
MKINEWMVSFQNTGILLISFGVYVYFEIPLNYISLFVTGIVFIALAMIVNWKGDEIVAYAKEQENKKERKNSRQKEEW